MELLGSFISPRNAVDRDDLRCIATVDESSTLLYGAQRKREKSKIPHFVDRKIK